MKRKFKPSTKSPFEKIKTGTRITLLESKPNSHYMGNVGKKRIVERIEGEKILFQEFNPDIGYWRHPDFLNSHVTKEIFDKSDMGCKLKLVYGGSDCYDVYLIEF